MAVEKPIAADGSIVSRKLIVAHRGDHSRAHPNTLDALEHSIVSGADMVELDVRRTADGEIVVHHDDVLDGQILARLTFQEASRLTGRLGYRLPRFTEFIAAAKRRVLLDIELKETGYEELVLGLIAAQDIAVSDFMMTAFDAMVLARVRSAAPDVRRGLLVSDVSASRAIELFHETGSDLLGPDCALIDESMLEDAARSAIPLLPWTVNEPPLIRRLLRAPAVMGVITDRPVDALRIRAMETDPANSASRRPTGADRP